MKKNDILKIIQKNGKKVKGLGVRNIGIFGSFVKSTQDDTSDVDILVEFRQGAKTFDNYMDLRVLLQKLLGRRVDLVVKDALKSRIRPHIIKETKYARL